MLCNFRFELSTKKPQLSFKCPKQTKINFKEIKKIRGGSRHFHKGISKQFVLRNIKLPRRNSKRKLHNMVKIKMTRMKDIEVPGEKPVTLSQKAVSSTIIP
jgi:hypothetical protein